MNRKLFIMILAVMLLLTMWGGLPAQKASAAITTVTIDYWPNTIAADAGFPICTTGGGTPFAVRVTVNGSDGDTATLQLFQTGAGFCMWDPRTSTWISYSAPATSYPRVTVGASGSTSLWLYGRATTGSGGSAMWLTAYPCNATFTDCTGQGSPISSANRSTTMRNMTSNGGWLDESNSTVRAGRAIAVKSGSTVVGLYVAEPNGVNEGYVGDGYYKVAVPHCASSCGYTIETWELAAPGVSVGVMNTMGLNNCPNAITAGSTTSLNTCNSPTAITLVSFSATTPAGRATLLALLLLACTLLLLSIRRRAQVRSNNR